MTATSSDVQGLTYFTWFGLGIIGGVIGTIVGVIDLRKLRAGKRKWKPDNMGNKRLQRIANKLGSRSCPALSSISIRNPRFLNMVSSIDL